MRENTVAEPLSPDEERWAGSVLHDAGIGCDPPRACPQHDIDVPKLLDAIERNRSLEPAARRASDAQVTAMRDALTNAHHRLEAFNPPNGRGLTFPGAWALDHEPGAHPSGCGICAALAAPAPQPATPLDARSTESEWDRKGHTA